MEPVGYDALHLLSPPTLQRALQAKAASLERLKSLHILHTAAKAGKAARGGGAWLALPLERKPVVQACVCVSKHATALCRPVRAA